VKSAPPRLAVSVPEAALQLGISRAHAFKMAASGELPTLKFGKRLVVPIAALNRRLEVAGEA
jgi:excisionase family DNA binding protein